MSGYPNLPARYEFGPEFRDQYPPENPETDFGADSLNLLLHQTSGHGLANPVRACVIGRYSTAAGAFAIDHREEAWNPKREQAHPVLARTGAGSYTLTFPATVLDRYGNAVPLSLIAVRSSIPGTTVTFTDGTKRVVQLTGTDDVQFWIEVA